MVNIRDLDLFVIWNLSNQIKYVFGRTLGASRELHYKHVRVNMLILLCLAYLFGMEYLIFCFF